MGTRRPANLPIRMLALLIMLAALVAYIPVLRAGFVNYDDNDYVTANRMVGEGLSASTAAWAFTTFHAANWHPVTWLSHQLDTTIYGNRPWGHHLTSVLLHAANSALLFVLLCSMTGCMWRSAFVAGLFALHPLHVESVAWVAERKDVLSTFFMMLVLLLYARYVAQRSLDRLGTRPRASRQPPKAKITLVYPLLVVAFALGLMAKPMLMTLPLLLLLLDWWPLDRRGEGWRRLVIEKLPLFALAAASAAVTFVAQRAGGTVSPLKLNSPGERAANAVVAYVSYLGKTVWPAKLAVFYPHPGKTLPLWIVAASAGVLVIITALIIRGAYRRPYLIVGWLWYLVTLVPVIGLVQVGSQGMADRYTYIPLIGIFLIAAWGIPDLLSRASPIALKWAAVSAIGLLMTLGAATWVQASYWKNSITLMRRAVAVAAPNAIAHNQLGTAYAKNGDLDLAVREFNAAILISPTRATSYYNLARVMWLKKDHRQAEQYCREAIRRKPNYTNAHFALGIILAARGRLDEAAEEFREVIRIDRNRADAHNKLGIVLAQMGKLDESIVELRIALRIDPNMGAAHRNLAAALLAIGDYEEAHIELQRATENGAILPPGLLEAVERARGHQ